MSGAQEPEKMGKGDPIDQDAKAVTAIQAALGRAK
jgi:hypothetical protein